MSFVKFLQGIGGRLGILEAVEGPGPTPERRIQTRIVTIQELAIEIKSREIRVLADSPAELSIPFEKIFETAGISSNLQDWTIERLRQWIASEPFKNKPREEIQKAILNQLSSESVPVETIIKDAIARDQALDSFESCMGAKMEERRESCRKRILEIEAQIQDLQQEMQRMEDRLKGEETSWQEWKRLKRAHERELASAASYIVDHPVITTDDEDAG